VPSRVDGRKDRQTDMTEQMVAFYNCKNAPKKCNKLLCFGMCTDGTEEPTTSIVLITLTLEAARTHVLENIVLHPKWQ